MYPNVNIAIRIMLTMPVNTASAEKFSKLKIIKNYLTLWSRTDLSGLAILSIEAYLAAKNNYKSLLDDFYKTKSRRTLLLLKIKSFNL